MKKISNSSKIMIFSFTILLAFASLNVAKSETGGGLWGIFGYADCAQSYQTENCSPNMQLLACGMCIDVPGCNATDWKHCKRNQIN